MDTTQSSLHFFVFNKHTVSEKTNLCALLEEEDLLIETVKHRGGSVPNRAYLAPWGMDAFQ